MWHGLGSPLAIEAYGKPSKQEINVQRRPSPARSWLPIANPRHLMTQWSFGIQDENLLKMVDEVRAPCETRLSEKLAVTDGLL